MHFFNVHGILTVNARNECAIIFIFYNYRIYSHNNDAKIYLLCAEHQIDNLTSIPYIYSEYTINQILQFKWINKL